MRSKSSRRDFLKLTSLLPFGLAASNLEKRFGVHLQQPGGQKNVLVIVFDAWSAYNVSLYGYGRNTTPNIDRLAERATVYHNHHAGGSFTTPGTASLLTGVLPWTHRAFESNGTLDEAFVTRNIFTAFQNHYSIAYTHNPWANTLLEQLRDEIDELVPWFSLFLRSYDDEVIHTAFRNDDDIASVSWVRNTNINGNGYSYSLLFSNFLQWLRERNIVDFRKWFPRGIPSIESSYNSFVLEDAVNWIENRLTSISRPFLGYFHFLPPHDPYRTRLEFYNHFAQDGFKPLNKPEDAFTQNVPFSKLTQSRMEYDEYLLYIDREFANLFDQLESSGFLENTWVVLTSDHGEMFERGILGHGTDTLYEPVIRVPLMIFEPGKSTRVDIHTPTSAIDVLPTLLHVTGQPIPAWVEGTPLPPYSASGPEPNRKIYAMRSNKNKKYAPLTRASVSVTQGRYKLHYYFGHKNRNVDEFVRLFDVEADPEELTDLSLSNKDVTDTLLNELKVKLDEVNKPYR